MVLNSQSPIPLYRQLADKIREELDAGRYEVASRIPSEHQLAADYGIGRPTVRQATDLLVRQGRLQRRRGSGTFVCESPEAIDLFSLIGTSAALKATDLDSSLELVHGPELIMGRAPDPATSDSVKAPSDNLPNETPQVLVERRARVSGTPVLYETFLLNASVFPGLEKRNLQDRSLSALIRDEYYLEPTSARQTFKVINADKSDAGKLEIAEGTALLLVSRELTFGQYGVALFAEILCRTDRFEFTQMLYPAQQPLVVN